MDLGLDFVNDKRARGAEPNGREFEMPAAVRAELVALAEARLPFPLGGAGD